MREQLFRRKPVGAAERGMIRSLNAKDLILLAIAAVIGAGIFSAIGTAAAGQVGPHHESIRLGAGPALILSFLLAGAVCSLAGLCYAELASMIPQAGSAYAYVYATLGEIIAWIVGFDLILEYAVGNVAVAISWGGYFNGLLNDTLHAIGLGSAPLWLTMGYRTALLSPNPEIHGVIASAPHIAGIPVVVNLPAFLIVVMITGLLLRGTRKVANINNIMVVIKLIVLAIFIAVGVAHLHASLYHPFAPNGFTGIHQGAAIVFFAFIGFDSVSTAAEETKNPQRNLPIGILAGLGVCTLIYIIVGAVLTGMMPYQDLGNGADPLRTALLSAGITGASWVVGLGAIISMAAVLLAFQYGQPRIFFAMAQDGLLPSRAARLHSRTHIPWVTTLLAGAFVATWALIGDAAEAFDLTNIGTLFAFMLVSIGVLVLRYKEPGLERAFKVPFVWCTSLLSAGSCVFLMLGLPKTAWVRFGIWLVIGIVFYTAYGYRHSKLRRMETSENMELGGHHDPVEPRD